MTDNRITKYQSDLARALRARGAYSRNLVSEIGDHLIDSVEAGRSRGLSGDAALAEAITRMGTPELVARQAAVAVPVFHRGALLAVCAATTASIGFLSLSLLLLRPPRANYRAWFAETIFVLTLTAATSIWVKHGEMDLPWSRALLRIGNAVLALLGGATLYIQTARNFEGYGLILGLLFASQALLALSYLRSRSPILSART